MTSRRRVIVALVALAALGLVEVLTLAFEHRRAPSAEQWQAAAAWVRQQRRPTGDLVVFAPEWVDPIGRERFGNLVPFDDAVRVPGETVGYGRLFEVSIRGKQSQELRGLLAAARRRGRPRPAPEAQARFGPISVRRYALPPTEVLADGADLMSRAKVSLVRGSSVTPCTPFIQNRWRCQGSTWNSAGATRLEVGYRGMRCVWAHPVDNTIKRIEIADVPVGDRLVGGVGLGDNWQRMINDNTAELAAFVNDREIGRITVGPNDGVVRFDWPTGAAAGAGRSGKLRFETRADKSAYARQLCFAAKMVRDLPADVGSSAARSP